MAQPGTYGPYSLRHFDLSRRGTFDHGLIVSSFTFPKRPNSIRTVGKSESGRALHLHNYPLVMIVQPSNYIRVFRPRLNNALKPCLCGVWPILQVTGSDTSHTLRMHRTLTPRSKDAVSWSDTNIVAVLRRGL